jgi:O-antigen ligase
VVIFGLSGIPGVARLAIITAVIILMFLFFKGLLCPLPKWVVLPAIFYFYLVLPALMFDNPPWEEICTFTTAFLGTIGVAIAFQQGYLPYRVIIYGMIVAALLNIYAIHIGYDARIINYSDLNPNRASGFTANSNLLAINCAFTTFMIWMSPEMFSWPVKGFGIFMAIYGPAVSGSRKGLFLAIILTIVIVTNPIIRHIKKMRISHGIVLILISTLLSGLIFYIIVKREGDWYVVDRTYAAVSHHDSSEAIREYLIGKGIELIIESPLVGYGFDQFRTFCDGTYAHNNYIEVWVSGGIIAIVMFYAMYLIVFIRAFKLPLPLRVRIITVLLSMIALDFGMVSFSDRRSMLILGLLFVFTCPKDKNRSEIRPCLPVVPYVP